METFNSRYRIHARHWSDHTEFLPAYAYYQLHLLSIWWLVDLASARVQQISQWGGMAVFWGGSCESCTAHIRSRKMVSWLLYMYMIFRLGLSKVDVHTAWAKLVRAKVYSPCILVHLFFHWCELADFNPSCILYLVPIGRLLFGTQLSANQKPSENFIFS